MRLRSLIAGVLWVATACAHSPPLRTGRLHIKCCAVIEGSCPEPDTESRLFVDGIFVGDCGDWPATGRAVRGGVHRVAIEKAGRGWAREDHDIYVPDDGQVTVELNYERYPD